MTRTVQGNNWSITMHQNVIDVESLISDDPDPKWRYKDDHGHVHCWRFRKDGKPTKYQSWMLKERMVAVDYCYECGHRVEETREYIVCRKCGDEIQRPGRSVKTETTRVPGLRYWDGWIEWEGKQHPRVYIGERFQVARFCKKGGVAGHSFSGMAICSGMAVNTDGPARIDFVGTGELKVIG